MTTVMAYLTIHLEGKPSSRHALEGDKPLILGRSHESDLWIDDSRLSRHHCRFEPASTGDGQWTVIDLASKNGTHVNGQRISSHKLGDGEEIEVGRARIVFHAGALPKPRPADPHASRAGDTAEMPAMGGDPSETLVDSRVGLPGMPSPKPRRVQDASAGPNRPLPFKRPPAQPIVGEQPKRGWLRALFGRRQ